MRLKILDPALALNTTHSNMVQDPMKCEPPQACFAFPVFYREPLSKNLRRTLLLAVAETSDRRFDRIA